MNIVNIYILYLHIYYYIILHIYYISKQIFLKQKQIWLKILQKSREENKEKRDNERAKVVAYIFVVKDNTIFIGEQTKKNVSCR